MKTRRVILEVLPSRLMLAVLRNGRVLEHRAARMEATDFAARWPEGLAPLRGTLTEWVSAMKLQGSDVTVLYTAPTALATVHSCPAAAGKQGAVRAAELAVRETGSLTAANGTLDLLPLVADTGPASETGRDPQRHTLTVGDTNASTQALAAWVVSAGLNPVEMMPHDAPALLLALEAATARGPSAKTGLDVWLWFGEHSSVVAAGRAGSLRFIRSVPIGSESLVDVLCRPIRVARTADEAGAPTAVPSNVTLERSAARRMLHAHGIPQPTQTIDAKLGIEGTAVLPLMQPVLQRLSIELKQSLRFGLNEQERAGARLRLCGPGVFIGQLGDSLAQLAGAGLPPTASGPGHEPPGIMVGEPAGGGTVAAWAALDRCAVNLLPEELQSQATLRRMRSFARAGMVGAAALIALYAGMGWMTLRTERQRLDAMRLGPGGNAQEATLQLTAKMAEQQMLGLRARIQNEMGETPPMGAVLAALSTIAPSEIKLTSIVLNSTQTMAKAVPDGGAGGTCAIEAVALTDDPQRLAVLLRELSARLEALPVVRKVRIGTTQRTEQRGRPAQRFDLLVSLNALPPQMAIGDAQSSLTAQGAGR